MGFLVREPTIHFWAVYSKPCVPPDVSEAHPVAKINCVPSDVSEAHPVALIQPLLRRASLCWRAVIVNAGLPEQAKMSCVPPDVSKAHPVAKIKFVFLRMLAKRIRWH